MIWATLTKNTMAPWVYGAACVYLAGPLLVESRANADGYSGFSGTTWAELYHEPPLRRCTALSIFLTAVTIFVVINTDELCASGSRGQRTAYKTVFVHGGLLHILCHVVRLASATHASLDGHTVVSFGVWYYASLLLLVLLPPILVYRKLLIRMSFYRNVDSDMDISNPQVSVSHSPV